MGTRDILKPVLPAGRSSGGLHQGSGYILALYLHLRRGWGNAVSDQRYVKHSSIVNRYKACFIGTDALLTSIEPQFFYIR